MLNERIWQTVMLARGTFLAAVATATLVPSAMACRELQPEAAFAISSLIFFGKAEKIESLPDPAGGKQYDVTFAVRYIYKGEPVSTVVVREIACRDIPRFKKGGDYLVYAGNNGPSYRIARGLYTASQEFVSSDWNGALKDLPPPVTPVSPPAAGRAPRRGRP